MNNRTNLSELYFGDDHVTIMKPQTGWRARFEGALGLPGTSLRAHDARHQGPL